MSPTACRDRLPNRLSHETSPYLLQHAYNPVDWYPWCEEAFERAREENKPIFLSVGYSACHWCHVMERESFENEEIAALLNEHYISIKVDREERPDIDQIYMSAVQLITRRGGWPMSVFLTPDGKPFYGGTYWPPTSRMGLVGFKDLLNKLHDYWTTKRDEVDESAERLVEAIQNLAAPVFECSELSDETLRHGMLELIDSADRVHGGFGGAPKFPHPMDLRVLLRGWQRFGNDDALHVAQLTLKKMAQGGIYDQLGGGFHRYSTDAYWLVPHFEKMLYDNALLVPAYLEMFQVTQDSFFARIVRESLDYVLREMTAPDGGFYSTQDADSEGEEGRYFVWHESETKAILGPEDAEIFNDVYDVSARGNWEGHCILNVSRNLSEAAAMLRMEPQELDQLLTRCRRKLLMARNRRVPPARDEKILAGWNGLMISAFAQAAMVLNEPRYQDAALRAAHFVLENLRDAQGRLLHCWKDGQARFPAYLDDYGCLIDGLLEAFQSSGDESLLTAALDLCDDVMERFEDQDRGGFFYTAQDHEQLIARAKDSQDNATPSGNGMMATALARIGHLTGREDLTQAAVRTLESLSGLLEEHPRACGQALIALDFVLGPAVSMIVVDADDESGNALLNEVWKPFLPRKMALRWPADQVAPRSLGLLQDKLEAGPSRLYVCETGKCQLPITSSDVAAARLAELSSMTSS